MTQVWDADKEQLKDVSPSDAKELAHLGVPIGAEAEIKSREAGWEGKVGAGATAFGNMLGMGLPKLITRAISPGTAHNIDSAQEAHPYITGAANVAGGIGSMAALPGAAARIAATAFTGGNEAVDRSAQSGEWDKAVQSGDYSKVAEHYAQGVGIGGVLGGVGEGAGYVLAKAAPASQRAVGRMLTSWSNKGYFQKVADLGEESNLAGTLAQKAEQRAQAVTEQLPQGAPFPAERPYAGMQMGPPPIPREPIPFAQAELHSPAPAENIGRARAHGDYDTQQAKMLADEPMTQSQSSELRGQYDREAHDAAATQEWDTGQDLARGPRALRDQLPPGLSDSEMQQFHQGRADYHAADPELNSAFEKAGLNQPAEPFSQISHTPERTEIPPSSQISTPPLNAQPPALPGPLAKLKGMQPTRAIPEPNLPQPKFPKFARPEEQFPSGQYEFAKGKTPKLPFAKTALRAGVSAAGFATGHPFLGYLMGERAAESGLLGLGKGLYQYAQKAAINRAQAISLMVDNVIATPLKLGSKVVRSVLDGNTGNVASSYLTGDTDKDYRAIVSGVAAAQANPEAVIKYVQERHGPLSTDGKFSGALQGHYQNGIGYLAQGIPKQARASGLLDGSEPYDPPRSVKVRLIQRYNGVNDPHNALVAPTHESVAAVQAVHPRTLEEIRQNLALELADEKQRVKLSSAQMRDISVIMGIPATWIHSPAGISAIAAIGQPPAQPPAPGAPKQSQAGPAKGVNLGGAGKNYASMVAPPSQANELDNLGEQ